MTPENTLCRMHRSNPSMNVIGGIHDESLTLYYLQNLMECKANILRGILLLRELDESEEQICQAVSLRSRSFLSVQAGHKSGISSSYPDQGILRVQLECDHEKRVIQKEKELLHNHLKKENEIIAILERCIFCLPEPHRSVIVGRYIERMTWSDMQKKFRRSASRMYVLNKQGIYAVHEKIRKYNCFTEQKASSERSLQCT